MATGGGDTWQSGSYFGHSGIHNNFTGHKYKSYEVYFPHTFTIRHPHGPVWQVPKEAFEVPFDEICHVTHDPSAYSIASARWNPAYVFKPNPKYGKKYNWIGSPSGETYREQYREKTDNIEYLKISAEQQLFPGSYSWWGISLKEPDSNEEEPVEDEGDSTSDKDEADRDTSDKNEADEADRDTADEGEAKADREAEDEEESEEDEEESDIYETDKNESDIPLCFRKFGLVADYLKLPPRSRYGNNEFSGQLSDVLQSYKRSRRATDVYLVIGGTLRYTWEICYVIIACTKDDLKGPLKHFPRLNQHNQSKLELNGLTDHNGKVVQPRAGLIFKPRLIFDQRRSWETLAFAFYFKWETEELKCNRGIINRKYILHCDCTSKKSPGRGPWECPNVIYWNRLFLRNSGYYNYHAFPRSYQ